MATSESAITNPAPGPAVAQSASTLDSGDSFAFLKALAEVSAVFIALTFIGGWSYLASYYKTFGLNPLELDVPIPVVCTLALYVLYNSVWPLLVIAALILVRLVFARRFQSLRRGEIATVLGLLLLTSAAAGLIRGRQLANRDVLLESDALPYVAFATKLEKNDLPSCVEFKTYGSLDCKLLVHFKNTYYFFYPVPIAGEGIFKENANMTLYTLSDSDVISMHVQRGLSRKARIE